jgi:hypothetical protein
MVGVDNKVHYVSPVSLSLSSVYLRSLQSVQLSAVQLYTYYIILYTFYAYFLRKQSRFVYNPCCPCEFYCSY